MSLLAFDFSLMEVDEQTKFIMEHWAHMASQMKFPVAIISLIVDFCVSEQFNKWFTHQDLVMGNGHLSVSTKKGGDTGCKTAIGSFCAKPGGEYAWTIKLGLGSHVAVGVIKEFFAQHHTEIWWKGGGWGNRYDPHGYCVIFDDDMTRMEVEIRLDLVRYTITFATGEKKDNSHVYGGAICIEKDREYRLAIAFKTLKPQEKAEIVSFNIIQ